MQPASRKKAKKAKAASYWTTESGIPSYIRSAMRAAPKEPWYVRWWGGWPILLLWGGALLAFIIKYIFSR